MPIPDNSVALAFTSPPYNVGKDYNENMSSHEYLGLIKNVGKDVYRALRPGGRYVINIANLGRKPYIPLHSYFYKTHMDVGFLPMGEMIWQKGKGASGNCAWGSWKSAKSPRLRDLHEYLLVFAKGSFSRAGKRGVGHLRGRIHGVHALNLQIPRRSQPKKLGILLPFRLTLHLG